MHDIYFGECYLRDALDPALTKLGFTRHAPENTYYRTTGSFQHFIRVDLAQTHQTHTQAAARLTLAAGLNAHTVESLVSQFRKATGRPLPTVTFKVTQHVAELSEARLYKLSRQVERTIAHKALPLLERYSSIKKLDALFNRNLHMANQPLGGLINRCFKGLALARFSHRRRFHQLYQYYLTRLDNQWAPRTTINSFTRLYNFLRIYALN